MVDSDPSIFKTLLMYLSAPITAIIGIIGWNHKNTRRNAEDTAKSQQDMQILVHEHTISIEYIHDILDKLEVKIDLILGKLT